MQQWFLIDLEEQRGGQRHRREEMYDLEAKQQEHKIELTDISITITRSIYYTCCYL